MMVHADLVCCAFGAVVAVCVQWLGCILCELVVMVRLLTDVRVISPQHAIDTPLYIRRTV